MLPSSAKNQIVKIILYAWDRVCHFRDWSGLKLMSNNMKSVIGTKPRYIHT